MNNIYLIYVTIISTRAEFAVCRVKRSEWFFIFFFYFLPIFLDLVECAGDVFDWKNCDRRPIDAV